MKPRIEVKYAEEIRPALMKTGKYSNLHEVPKLQKIVINMGVSSKHEKTAVDDATKELGMIAGQRPVVTRSRKSIANFKLRENQPVGCFVTLRRGTMYEFLDRLVSSALPRIRDFRGISPRKFDGRGNYSLGISDQTIFPEIELDKIKRTQGMDITFVTTAKSDKDALELLKLLGMPFAER